MKERLGRELWWMIAPVLLLGGGAWWLQSGGKMKVLAFKNPLDPGPIRVEFSPFEKVELSPFDVSQGFDWAAKTHIETVGKWDEPPGWKTSGVIGGSFSSLRLVYRRGQKWKNAPLNAQRLVSLLRSSVPGTSVFGVDLKTVPRDAEEVRLRGAFQQGLIYSGAIPPGWKPPKNMKITGPNRWLTLRSKPFDVQIKGPNEPMPMSAVSRRTPLKLVDAKWLVTRNSGVNQFLLQLRRQDGLIWSAHPPTFIQKQIWDANGQLVSGKGWDTGTEFSAFDRNLFSPQLPSTDLVVAFVAPLELEAERAFSQVKAPIRLRAQITDGGCWPLSIDVRVPRVEMKLKDFGAAK